jgi:hypothetical protein
MCRRDKTYVNFTSLQLKNNRNELSCLYFDCEYFALLDLDVASDPDSFSCLSPKKCRKDPYGPRLRFFLFIR